MHNIWWKMGKEAKITHCSKNMKKYGKNAKKACKNEIDMLKLWKMTKNSVSWRTPMGVKTPSHNNYVVMI